MQYMEVSAKAGTGINDAFTTLALAILKKR
jgi:hypothetical protein